MIKVIISIVAVCSVCLGSNALNMYDSYVESDSLTEMIPVYVGPLYCTGAALRNLDSDTTRYIERQAPNVTGRVEPNSIILNGDSVNPEEVYSFNMIKYYKVTQNNDTFFVMHMNATMNHEKYDIIVDLRSASYYNRTIYIIRDNTPCFMILWLDGRYVLKRGKEI